MNDNFTVKWEKQKWEFKVASPLVPLVNTTITYHGKVEKVFFLVKWNRHDDTYTIQWDDLIHTGSAWFHRTIAEAIQTIMADRAGFTMYERWRKNYPTAKSSAPTNLHIGNARVYVVRYTDNTRWWYEAISTSRDDADWVSKLFKPEVQPSKEHLLKQMIKGNFTFYAATETIAHENGTEAV